MTIENWTVVLRCGLKVNITFAKYEKIDAVINATVFDQKGPGFRVQYMV